jgi:hypothetical protein
MKAKVLVVFLCVMVALASLSIGKAEAAFVYVTCTISAAGGISNGSSYIIVTDTNTGAPAFPANTRLTLDNSTNQSKEFLASALTAWANAGNVEILVNTPVAAFDLCFGVACKK